MSSDDHAWLRSWFDEQNRADDDPLDEATEVAGAQDWRHGSRPVRRHRSRPPRAVVALGVLAVLALGGAVAGGIRADVSAAPSPQALDPDAATRAAAELAVHEHITTGDGRRWVDAARAVAVADTAVPGDLAAAVVLVDAVVLDGPPSEAAEPAEAETTPRWVARRRARYAVALRCATACEPAALPWPVPVHAAGGGARPRPAATADDALQAAGYRDVRIESRSSLGSGLEELTVVARPPGVSGVERVVVWARTTADGTAVVGVP